MQGGRTSPTPEDLAAAAVPVDPDQPLPTLYRPVGCSTCSNTGYHGRIAMHEVMAVTEEIERLAVARASSAEIGRTAREQGMLTLREDGWAKVAARPDLDRGNLESGRLTDAPAEARVGRMNTQTGDNG